MQNRRPYFRANVACLSLLPGLLLPAVQQELLFADLWCPVALSLASLLFGWFRGVGSVGSWQLVRSLSLYVGFFWLGYAIAAVHFDQLSARLRSDSIGDGEMIVSGVLALPEQYGERIRFDLISPFFHTDEQCHHRVEQSGKRWFLPNSGRRMRLDWYDAAELRAGEFWCFRVKVRRPRGNRSPGSFDREAWAAREGVGWIGYVRQGERLRSDGNRPLVAARASIRHWLYESINPDSAALLTALLTGDKSGISWQQWEWFNRSGTTHLMVISGLHIGLMSWLGHSLMYGAGRIGLLPLRHCFLPRLASLAGLLFAVVYAFLAGFSVPVQRALVMAGIAFSGPLLGLKVRHSTLFLLALCVVIALEPLAITGAGFWYSFLAVGILLYSCSARQSHQKERAGSIWERMQRRTANAMYPQLWVFLMLTPMMLFNYQPVSLLSPLINWVAIPVVAGLVVPLAFLALLVKVVHPFSAGLILKGLEWLTGCWEWLLDLCTALPLYVPSLQPNRVALLFALVGVLIMASPAALGLRRLGWLCLLPLLFPAREHPEHGNARIAILDVGQGLAVLVQTRKHLLLYDTGPGAAGRFSSVGNVVLPYMAYRGLKNIDRLVISHGDSDHAGGVEKIVQRYPKVGVYVGSTVANHAGHASPCLPGVEWVWDGVHFEFLSGSKSGVPSNERSCVLKVAAHGKSLLLSGDIGRKTEAGLLAEYGSTGESVLGADVLLIPHHGSKYSSTDAFLDAVKPECVVVSSGYGNRFSHPHKTVLERIGRRGVLYYNTAYSGTVMFTLGTAFSGYDPWSYSHRRYWWQ